MAAVAGLCLAAAFPKIGIAGLAWVAPALMLVSAHGKTGGAAFRIGYAAGLTFHLASLYWLLLIPVKGYPILGWISLSAYLALYPAAWLWVVSRIGSHDSDSGWTTRTIWALFGAASWVSLEMIQARLLSGFPWSLLGVSQYQMSPLIQIASIAGVYGVSFLVVWVSLSMLSAVTAIFRQPTMRHVWMGEIILPLTAIVAVFVFGLGQLRKPDNAGPALRVVFIQPSIPQTMIWNENENENRFRQLLDLTGHALTLAGHGGDQATTSVTHPQDIRPPISVGQEIGAGQFADLLLWPEAAVPKMIRYDEETFRTITDLARSNRVWMILGCDDAKPRGQTTKSDEADYFNGSFLVSPEGELANVYHKRHLVMFGEYLPLVRRLPFVKWLTPITGSFTPGEKLVKFELARRSTDRPKTEDPTQVTPRTDKDSGDTTAVKTATLICFEDVFPHLVREYADKETDFLVNLTNDGWFGESAAQWQHAANAVFRAVENGLPLLRSCNNGLTCWIDSRGRIREILRDDAHRVYGPGTMTVTVPLRDSSNESARTFYNENGDWFGWVCVGLTVLAGVARMAQRRTRR